MRRNGQTERPIDKDGERERKKERERSRGEGRLSLIHI